MGGNGKSLLAREYSIRFGPAYPGGIFWLNAYWHDDTKGPLGSEQREALRQDQLQAFATELQVPTEGLKPSETETHLWHAIEKRGEPCLWIVDDVPSGIRPSELQSAWVARRAGASTLMTTRSQEYGALGDVLDLAVLSPAEALGLLCSQRQPANSAEECAAEQIVELLGYHPLAVEVAGSYLAQGIENFESYRQALENPAEDAVEFGRVLKENLPTGHERSISATLLKEYSATRGRRPRVSPSGFDPGRSSHSGELRIGGLRTPGCRRHSEKIFARSSEPGTSTQLV